MPKAATPQNSQEARDAHGLRPRLRPLFNAVVLNGTLAIALLGVPWYRGRTRAETTVHAYVEYAACLHAGTVNASPGLALPDGHRERFAALYLEAVPEWPASCRDALDRIPRDEALFLMPGAKTGEEEVRAAAIGARSALDEVTEARASEDRPQIPQRLLRTLDHLAAAVSVQVSETGLPLAIDHLAFDLGQGPSLVSPSRVPLQTGAGGPLFVSVRAAGLRAVSADGRSASVVEVHDGTVDTIHVRRSPSARALLDDGENAYLGWVTGEATCAHDEAHCARRLTGLARIRDGVSSPEAEVWIAAHPALPLARSFALHGTDLAVISREADGGVGLRRFSLPEAWPDPLPPTDGPVQPLLATGTPSLGIATDVAIVDDEPIVSDGGAVLVCGSTAIVVRPNGVEIREVVHEQVTIGDALEHIERPETIAAHAIEVAPPTRNVEPLEDHARCAVSESGVSFAWIDRAGWLHLVPDVDAWHEQPVAQNVSGFAMSRTGETVTFGTWGADGHRAVTLRRVWHGRVLSRAVAAACWDDGAGLCGPAGIASSGEGAILYSRAESDLLVLRLTPTGVAALPRLD